MTAISAAAQRSWRGAILGAALAVGSAAAPAAFAATPDLAPADPQERFIQAISDAAVPTSGEVDDRLIPIRRDNAGLKWEGPDAEARVKVVSWMSEQTFQNYYANPVALPTDKTAPSSWNVVMWVTAVPQVQDFCRSLGTKDTAAISARLLQLIGLPPSGQNARFVEMWVSPKDMMRPCPDAEVDDNQCQLDATNPVADDYRAWFNANFSKSYSVKGALWTRLGYTYDWASAEDTANPRKPMGASEFILKPNTPYTITGRYTTAEYCSRAQ